MRVTHGVIIGAFAAICALLFAQPAATAKMHFARISAWTRGVAFSTSNGRAFDRGQLYRVEDAGTLDVRVAYRKALDRYMRSTQDLTQNAVIWKTFISGQCDFLGENITSARTSNQSTVNIDVIALMATRQNAASFSEDMKLRMQSSRTIRRFFRAISQAGTRPDVPEDRASAIRRVNQMIELKFPEISSETYEEAVGVDTNAGSEWLSQLSGLNLGYMSIQDAMQMEQSCRSLVLAMSAYPYDSTANSPDEQLLSEEEGLYAAYKIMIDKFGDLIASQ